MTSYPPPPSAPIQAPSTQPADPTVYNGTTVHGILGQKGIRHPWELPMLAVGIIFTVLAMLAWLVSAAVVIYGLVIGEYTPESISAPSEQQTFTTWAGLLWNWVSTPVMGFIVQIVFIVGIMWIVIFIARAMMYANYRLRGVRMSPTQFPEGYRMVAEAAQYFGMRRIPDAYVVTGNGVINAFAFGHGLRRIVVVHSDLFEVGGKVRDPDALRFVIAHELGHHAAGHVSYFRILFSNLLHQVPIIGMAYSRAQEYTADNYGYAFCPQGAMGTIGVLGAGKYLNADVNTHEVADRAHTEGGLWTHLSVWFSATHPPLTWRAHALRDRSKPGSMWIRPGGNLFSAPLVPGGTFSKSYPTPAEALAMLDAADRERPAWATDQFGRFPGVDYTGLPAIRDMQVAAPLRQDRTSYVIPPGPYRDDARGPLSRQAGNPFAPGGSSQQGGAPQQ